MTEVDRDRWGRPLIIPAEGGKPVPYARASSFGDVLDDKTNLTNWKMRGVATALVERPDLRLAVAASQGDNRTLNKVCDEALNHSGGNRKAGIGTSLHTISETLDRGVDLGFIPEEYQGDIDAYITATQDFQMVLIEQFVVNDKWKIAGTPDRVVRYNGENYIFDLKTGSVAYGWPKIAVQLAVYADGLLYNPETGAREAMPEVHPYKGIVLHLPSGSGEATLYWVDLGVGRQGIALSSQVREWRTNTRRGVADNLLLQPASERKATA